MAARSVTLRQGVEDWRLGLENSKINHTLISQISADYVLYTDNIPGSGNTMNKAGILSTE